MILLYYMSIAAQRFFCIFGIHQWVIGKYTDNKGRFKNAFRECESCDKEQELGRPKKYHPIKYIWIDTPKGQPKQRR